MSFLTTPLLSTVRKIHISRQSHVLYTYIKISAQEFNIILKYFLQSANSIKRVYFKLKLK